MRDGTVHPVQVGLRLVEELRMRCKDSVEEDPLEAVAVIYERELTKIKASLEGGALEEFNALCPTLLAPPPQSPETPPNGTLFAVFGEAQVMVVILISLWKEALKISSPG